MTYGDQITLRLRLCYCLCCFDGVKHKETGGSNGSTGLENVVARGRHARRGSYQPVFDSRKRRVRGFWKRNDRYYAQLKVVDGSGRKFAKRFPLGDEANPVDTVAKAIEAMGKRKSARADEKLKVARGGKKFFAYVNTCLAACKLTHDARHTFLSVGVMAGIDFMTLAKWAGHQDGGILVGNIMATLPTSIGRRWRRS